MPIYEYQCLGCGDVFEERQKITDAPLKKHAACGSKKVKKLISMTSFQLKGEGWYVTDYKKKPESKDKETDAKPAAEKTEKTDAAETAAKTDKPEKADKKSEKKPEKKKSKGEKAA